MISRSALAGSTACPSSHDVSTLAIQGLTAEFDRSVAALPQGVAQPVRLPVSARGRADFLKQLAMKSAARLAAGGTALVLVLLSAESAQAQGADVSLASLDGVKSVVLEEDGSATVTMENGSVMRLPAGSFTNSGGDILVSEAVAAQVAEAAAAAGGGVSGGAIAAGLGGLALVGAAAGGGGGGGSSDDDDSSSSSSGGGSSTPAPTTSGTVVDGYIVNATVFQDVNGNSVFDAGEPNTTTDGMGNFDITLDPSSPSAKLVSFGGTDSSTGQPFTGILTAPAGSEVITPLTTLVQSLVEKSAADGNPISVADANAQLAAALGLEGENLLELDPVEAIENADSPEDAAAFAAAAQVASVIAAAAAAQDGGAAETAEASEAAAAVLAEQLLQAAEDDPDTADDVLNDEAVIQEALEEAGVETDEAADIAAQVDEANDLIDVAAEGDNPGDIQIQIEAVQEVVQDTLVDAIEDDGTDINSVDVEAEADAIVPLRPVVDTEASGTFGPNDNTVSLSGTGRPGTLVRASVGGESVTTTVDDAGNWIIAFDAVDLLGESGPYTVEVAGAPSGSNVYTTAVSGGAFDLDVTPPAVPVIAEVAGNNALELEEQVSDLTVTGTTDANASVDVTIGGTTESTTADADGNFSVTFANVDVPGSDFTVSATATDALGNESAPGTQPVTVEPVSTLVPTVDPVSGDFGAADLAAGLAVSGTGRPGSTVTVTIAGVSQNVDVAGDGSWSTTFAEDALPDATGDYTVTAAATLAGTPFDGGPVDGGGFSVDVTAPSAPVIDPVTGDNVLTLEEQVADLTISGTAEAGSTVAVTIGGVTESTVAAGDGSYSVTFDAADVPGAGFSVSATATDPLGNESNEAAQAVTLEPVSALTPTVTPVSGVFGAEQLAAGLTVTGTGRAGSTVTVTIAGVTQDAAVAGDGSWSATFAEADLPAETGDYTVTATASLSGTPFVSGSVAGGGFSVDLDAADAPTLDMVAGDDVIDLEERDDDLTVSGSTEAGATVDVTIGGVTETTTAAGDGSFSVTFDAADVPTVDFTISATATDGLGNTSASALKPVTVEPVSALEPVIDPVSGVLGAADLASGLTVTGTGRIGSTVTVTIAGVTQDAVVAGDGSWSASFAEADLPDATGDYQVSATATLTGTAFTSDPVGGGGFSVDLTGPDAPVIDPVTGDNALSLEEQAADLTISGNAEAGSTVDVTIGGVTESTVAAGDGSFSVTFDAADIPGAGFSVSSTATDPLGNAGSEGTQPVTLEPVSALTPTVDDATATLGRGDRAGGLEITGTGRAGSTVTVTINGVTEAATVAANGQWDVYFTEVDLPDADGVFAVSAVATLPGTSFTSGSVSGGDLTFDLTEPDAPVIDSVTGDDFLTNAEQDVDLTITGTAEAGATVTVTVGDASQDVVAAGDGTFSATFDAADIPADDFAVTAFATDAAENEGDETSRPVVVQVAGETINGTAGGDDLTGTGGDDTIDPQGNDGDDIDIINGSFGNDVIDLSNSGGTSFVEFNYDGAGLPGPITATIDYLNNVGSVDKGAAGQDVIISPATPGEGFGIGLIGTGGDDTFNIVQSGNETWAGIFYSGGDDTINIDLNTGVVRIGLNDDDNTVNLVTGEINVAYDGGGSNTLDVNVSGTGGRIEIQTRDGDDDVTGTGRDERFILGSGTDVLNAGGGEDLIRYDRSGIEGGVTVDLQAGTATGFWNNQVFSHTLIGVENVRGSRSGNDSLTANDVGSELDGRGGNDLLIGGAGDDLLIGGDGSDTFVVGQGNDTIRDYEGADTDNIQLDPDFSDAVVDAAVAAAQQDGDDVVITLSPDASIRLEGWTVADFQADYASGSAGQDIIGTGAADVLDGTVGDDFIDPNGNDGDDVDVVNGSLGDDDIDFSNSGGTSFVDLDYSGLSGPIAVSLDYGANTGSVEKGIGGFNGTDTLINPEVTGEAFGIGFFGTSGDDTYNVVQDGTFTWTGLFYRGGNDTIDVTLNEGIVQIDSGRGDVVADLSTGDITFDDGSIDLTVSGTGGGRIEFRTFDGNDDVTGSDRDERFILGAGTDVLDAGGGNDTVRYDRNQVTDGVTVDLEAGTATGTWDGQAFSHTLINVEEVRGSRTGNDDLTAANSGSVLDGRGGNDLLTGGTGSDRLIGGDGFDTFRVGQGGTDTIQDYQGSDSDRIEFDPGFTAQQVSDAVDAATQDGDTVVLSLPGGATIRIDGWDVADFQSDFAASNAGETIIGSSEGDDLVGTDGNDFIDPAGNDGDDTDFIRATTGNDQIDFSASGGTSFVDLDYIDLDGPIVATIDYLNNTGTVDKGAQGFDTLLDPLTTGEAFGIGLFGTNESDIINIIQGDTDTWFGFSYDDGDDVINATLNTGTIRIDSSSEATTANLATGDITFAGGSIDLNVTGDGGRIEFRTFDNNDNVTGSDRDERFILGAGTDVLDAGDGYDTVRYDRGDVTDGVTVNLENQTASGTWDGQAFNHTLINVEQVRGSRTGDDTLTAANSGSDLFGRGGNDTLIGGNENDFLAGEEGDDTLTGGGGSDLFLVGLGNDTITDYEAGVDVLDIETNLTNDQIALAVTNAVQDGLDAVVNLPDGNSVRFEGWTVADLQTEYATVYADQTIIGTDGDDDLQGAFGNDFIDPAGNNGDVGDIVRASDGNDTIELGNSGGTSFVDLNYSDLGEPIFAEVNYRDNDGFVDKGGNGFDTILNPLTTGEAFGISLFGTGGDDRFDIIQGDTDTWIGIRTEGGNDTINAELSRGIIRIETSLDDVTADLSTGDISFGGNTIDLNVTGSGGQIELRTRGGDDTVTGSDLDERFILGTGTDWLDAGDGTDLVRYDRSGVQGGVTVNLQAGTATGTWDGEVFNHTLINVESVRGSRTGNDDLTAADSGSILEGRGGDDTYTGGLGEDTFIVGEGSDTVLNFDIDIDQLQTRNGDFDFGLPPYSEVDVDGEASLQFDFGGGDSVTLVGVTESDLENTIAQEVLSLSPGSLDNPATLEINGDQNYEQIVVDATGNLVSQSASEFTFSTVVGPDTYTLSVTGSGLSVTAGPPEVLSGTVDAAVLSVGGAPVWSLTDLGIPLSDFSAMIDSFNTNGDVIDYSVGIGDRDLIVTGDDAAQVIEIDGVDQWVETGGGADTVSFGGGGNAAIILGDGADTVNILGGTPAEDRAFIYIDPDDTGTDVINGFRFTDDENTGDRIVIEGGRGEFSAAVQVDDVTDQDALDAVAAGFGDFGEGEYVLFYEADGDAVLQELIGNDDIGGTVATFANADVSQISAGNTEGFVKISDIEIPPASELV